MSHFIKPINKQEQKKIMKKKKKKRFYMLDMPLIRYFICRIYLSSLLHTCESHGKKKKKNLYLAFLVWEKGMCAHKFMKDNIYMSDAWNIR